MFLWLMYDVLCSLKVEERESGRRDNRSSESHFVALWVKTPGESKYVFTLGILSVRWKGNPEIMSIYMDRGIAVCREEKGGG